MANEGRCDSAHVSLARLPGGAQARTPGSVYQATRRALELLGGISRFVQPGQLVLLKPNQTVFLPAEGGVTTDPWVVAALARLVLEAGGRPVVGDIPGAGLTAREVMSLTGMDDAAQGRSRHHLARSNRAEAVACAARRGRPGDRPAGGRV